MRLDHVALLDRMVDPYCVDSEGRYLGAAFELTEDEMEPKLGGTASPSEMASEAAYAARVAKGQEEMRQRGELEDVTQLRTWRAPRMRTMIDRTTDGKLRTTRQEQAAFTGSEVGSTDDTSWWKGPVWFTDIDYEFMLDTANDHEWWRKIRRTTPRGFVVYGEFKDTHGSTVTVQQSSAWGMANAWIFCEPQPSPHLDMAQARTLIAALETYIEDNEE